MKTTINYTNTLSKFDNSKIPIEQQICLLKAPDAVKEKAMVKLKEVKAKSEDSGSKARQYLEGLLKIPFGIYRKEPILSIMSNIKDTFGNCIMKIRDNNINVDIPKNSKFGSLEIAKYFPKIEKNAVLNAGNANINKLVALYTSGKRDTLVANICFINGIIKKQGLKITRLCHSGKKNEYMRIHITKFIKDKEADVIIIKGLQQRFPKMFNCSLHEDLSNDIMSIRNDWTQITNVLDDVNVKLDEAVHGHVNAKRQLQRIIGQWINGEQKGYCFGFEGPPGVGKTSLAKKRLSRMFAR